MLLPYSLSTSLPVSGGTSGPAEKHERRLGIVTINRHKSPVDSRPFQARASLERQQALEAQYGRVAIDDVVAALFHLKAVSDEPREPVARAA
jgi:hypothetical protein